MNDPWSELESMADLALQANAGDDQCYDLLLGQQPASHSTSFTRRTSATTAPKTNRASTKKTYYLVKLDGPLSSPEIVRVAGGLPTLPETFKGSSNLDGEDSDSDLDTDLDDLETPQETLFCRINNTTKDKILSWVSSQPLPPGQAGWRPTIIKDSAAAKDLSTTSAYPTLGVDTTLPQNGLSSTSSDLEITRPTQNEYPVWYFFYGTLADPTVLRRLFDLPSDFLITTWGNGKYNALVISPLITVIM